MFKNWMLMLALVLGGTIACGAHAGETGVVMFYNEAKGFGFIMIDGSDRKVIVYAAGLKDNVKVKDAVTFDVEETKKGLAAVNVKLK